MKQFIICALLLNAFTSVYVNHHHHHGRPRPHHHRHPKHWHSTKARNSWWLDQKVDSHARAGSKGKGHSRAFAGPQGTKGYARGTKGSFSDTNFNNEEKAAQSNWIDYQDSHGNKA